MAHNFQVGDRVKYIEPAIGLVFTKSMIERVGTVTYVHNPSGKVVVNFDNATSQVQKQWSTRCTNIKLLTPQTEEEKLSMLLNRHITPEQYERMHVE